MIESLYLSVREFIRQAQRVNRGQRPPQIGCLPACWGGSTDWRFHRDSSCGGTQKSDYDVLQEWRCAKKNSFWMGGSEQAALSEKKCARLHPSACIFSIAGGLKKKFRFKQWNPMPSEIAIAIACAGAFVGLVGGGVALFNSWKAVCWKRAEFANTCLKDFDNNPELVFAGRCLDWNGGKLLLPKSLWPYMADGTHFI